MGLRVIACIDSHRVRRTFNDRRLRVCDARWTKLAILPPALPARADDRLPVQLDVPCVQAIGRIQTVIAVAPPSAAATPRRAEQAKSLPGQSRARVRARDAARRIRPLRDLPVGRPTRFEPPRAPSTGSRSAPLPTTCLYDRRAHTTVSQDWPASCSLVFSRSYSRRGRLLSCHCTRILPEIQLRADQPSLTP